jgi:hypothetical protein
VIADPVDTGMVSALEMYIELIPQEWGLGGSRVPQKWVFEVVDEEIIINARPMGAYHDQFPFFSLEPEFDGYSLHSRSPGEVIKPLEDTITWLFNSHYYNVRKVLNDQFVVDPTRIEMADVLDPLPGGVIRAKPAAYGTDLRTAITQLQVQDVTASHLNDTRYVLDLLQRVDGVNDSVLGLISGTGRKTATEVRQGSTFSVSRLKTKAEMLSAMGFSPLALVALQNTQQYYSQDMVFRTAGSLAANLPPFVQVNPESIAGAYDFVPVDGDMPLDRFALANLWRQLFADVARMPEMAGQLDFMAIFSYAAKLAGATEVDQFRIQTVPDGQLQQQAQAGNVVPIGGQGGAAGQQLPGGGQAAGVEQQAQRLPLPSQIPGLGPVG